MRVEKMKKKKKKNIRRGHKVKNGERTSFARYVPNV
jgi:hypothetical protein